MSRRSTSLHKDRLAQIDTFKIGNIRYRVDNGTIVAVSRYSSASDIYTINQTSKGEDKVEFNDVEGFPLSLIVRLSPSAQ